MGTSIRRTGEDLRNVEWFQFSDSLSRVLWCGVNVAAVVEIFGCPISGLRSAYGCK